MERSYVEGQFDCVALAAAVRREVFGQDVTLPSERWSGPFGRSAQLAGELSDYGVRTEAPVEGDAVLLVVLGRLQHIGVYCVIDGEPWVLHNASNFGAVVRQRLREMSRFGYTVEGFYKWK